MANENRSTSANGAHERVNYAEAYQHFSTLESASDSSQVAFQDKLQQTIELLQKAIRQRSLDGVLSENESFFELENDQIYAFLLEYFVAMLMPKQTFFQQQSEETPHGRDGSRNAMQARDHERNLAHRVRFLAEADVFHTQFLDRAEQMGILTEKKRRDQYDRMESKQFSMTREEKIERFQVQRELEKKLQEVRKRREAHGGRKLKAASNGEVEDEELDAEVDEVEREQLMTFTQLAVIKSMEEQASVNQEREMLEKMLQMNAESAKRDLFSDTHRAPPPKQGQGISVTHINPQFEMRRETIRSGVFQPGHRLPTMSLEEYAEQELADAKERQRREQEAPQAPRRYDQLAEDGDEDDDKLVDEATYKDRAWDDWKDANPRGIGNKKGSQL